MIEYMKFYLYFLIYYYARSFLSSLESYAIMPHESKLYAYLKGTIILNMLYRPP